MAVIRHLLIQYKEFVRFCIVGVIATAVDAVIFYSVLRIAPYPIALVAGYCISLVLNYLLTVYWTFHVRSTVKYAVGIVGAHLINLFVVRMGLMWLFTVQSGLPERIAYVPTLFVSVITNFVIIKTVIVKLR